MLISTGRQVTSMTLYREIQANENQAHKQDHELSSELFDELPLWLKHGKLQPNKPKVLHGLDAVPEGFQEYRDGVISAYKIVYEL